ncbi:MAG: hypothetical protein ACOH5I_21175 [Oligoflexus sp.]
MDFDLRGRAWNFTTSVLNLDMDFVYDYGSLDKIAQEYDHYVQHFYRVKAFGKTILTTKDEKRITNKLSEGRSIIAGVEKSLAVNRREVLSCTYLASFNVFGVQFDVYNDVAAHYRIKYPRLFRVNNSNNYFSINNSITPHVDMALGLDAQVYGEARRRLAQIFSIVGGENALDAGVRGRLNVVSQGIELSANALLPKTNESKKISVCGRVTAEAGESLGGNIEAYLQGNIIQQVAKPIAEGVCAITFGCFGQEKTVYEYVDQVTKLDFVETIYKWNGFRTSSPTILSHSCS